MKRHFFFIGLGLWLLTLLSLCGPALAGEKHGRQASPSGMLPAKRYALVVGIGTYAHWTALPNSIEDAGAMSNALKQEGFEVNLLTNPGGRELMTALEQLADGVGQDEDRSILIYFAGHGETRSLPDGKRSGWLIPADCPQPGKDHEAFQNLAVSMAQIVKLLSGIKARHVLTLLDTAVFADGLNVSLPSLNLLVTKYQRPVRQFIVAGGPDAPPHDRSMFKHYLLKGLEGDADTVRDGYITGSELAVYLKQELVRGTNGRQHSQYASMALSDLPRGDFTVAVFKPLSKNGWLTINTTPPDARIRVLNIKPAFEQGMALIPGKYRVEVTADQYLPWRNRIVIEAGRKRTLDVALKKVGTLVTNDLGMTLTLIRAGHFKMGSSRTEKLRHEDEADYQSALASPFYMQTTEVTQDQFARFIQATGYTTTGEQSKQCWSGNSQGKWQVSGILDWRTKNTARAGPAGKDAAWPVACVSWKDAQAFVRWLSDKEGRSYRLPTEAQWEYACRAGSKGTFSSGPCLSMAQANFNGAEPYGSDCAADTQKPHQTALPVASFAPNAWGLYDMHGNAAEWCRDWYGPYPRQRTLDPAGLGHGTEKVIRGGHFNSGAAGCRSARRLKLRPDISSQAVGFRVVMLP